MTAPSPSSETEAAILRIVVRQYPHGGNQLEPAIRMAIALAWRARHQFSHQRETNERKSDERRFADRP